MADFAIQEAGVAEAAEVAEVRRLLVADARHIAPDDLDPAFLDANAAFIAAGLAGGTYRAWLATTADGLLVGGIALTLGQAPPLPGELRTSEGWVLATWVHPAYRSRGIARALLTELEAAAHDAGVRRLFLFATDDGRPLYDSLGYQDRSDLLMKPLMAKRPR